MPVQYEGAKAEHFAVRDGVGLFDVSHMGEVFLLGSEALKAADHLVTNRVAHLEDGQACYAGLLNEKGGFIDDVVVYRIHSERVMICLNASNAEKDIDWIRRQVGHRVDVVDRCEQTAQIAVQGPKAAQLLQTLTSIKLDDIPTYRFALGDVAGSPPRSPGQDTPVKIDLNSISRLKLHMVYGISWWQEAAPLAAWVPETACGWR